MLMFETLMMNKIICILIRNTMCKLICYVGNLNQYLNATAGQP